MAEDAVVGLTEGRQGKGVGGGAVEDKEDLARRLENVAKEVGRLFGPGVFAVADFMSRVGSGHGREGLGANPGVIVAGKMAWSEWHSHAATVAKPGSGRKHEEIKVQPGSRGFSGPV